MEIKRIPLFVVIGLVAVLGVSTVPAASAAAADSWGPPITVSGSSTATVSEPQIVSNDDGSIMNAIWVSGSNEIVTARSADSGLTWSAPVVRVSDSSAKTNLRFATSGDVVAAIWVSAITSPGTIQVISSQNSGASWGAPVTVSTSLGGQTPQIVTDGTHITAIWIGNDTTGDSDLRVQSKTSNDKGVSWPSGRVLVSDDRPSTLGASPANAAGPPQIVTDGTTLTAIWTRQDDATANSVVQTKSSADRGLNWSTATDLSDADDVATDTHLALNGTRVTAIWEKTTPGTGTQRSIQVVSSNVDGTWTSPVVPFNLANGLIPRLVAYGTTVTAVWYSSAAPATASSDAGGAWSTALGLGGPVDLNGARIASDGTTATIIWNNPADGSIQARSSSDKGMTWASTATLSTATGVSTPQVVANGAKYTAIWSATNKARVTSLGAAGAAGEESAEGASGEASAEGAAGAQSELAATGSSDTVVWVGVGVGVGLLLGGALLAIVTRKQHRRL